MKRICFCVILSLFLFGCGNSDCSNTVLLTRKAIQDSTSCSFKATVTADYEESIYTFKMDCIRNQIGNVDITLTEPDVISGLSARICEGTGKLIFDDTIFAVDLIADGVISPLSAPWLFLEALNSGYISFCGTDGELIHTRIDDSFSGVQFNLDLWQNSKGVPVRSEIIWEGRRILSIDIDSFTIL